MWTFIKRFFVSLILAVVLIYLLLVLLGGGFGTKEITPDFSTNNLRLFAHRGVPTVVPENSLAAISTAKQVGFSAIEIDIQETADKQLVLFHDETAERLLKKSIAIDQIAYADLAQLPLVHADSFSQHRVITLERAFAEFGDSFIYYLDIKCENQVHFYDLAKRLNGVISKFGLQNKTIIASSNVLFIGFIEYYYPDLLTVLEGFNAGKEWIYDGTPKKFCPDFVSSFYTQIDAAHIQWLKKRKLLHRKIIYGVSEKNYQQLYTDFGISNMIIDYDSSLDVVLKK